MIYPSAVAGRPAALSTIIALWLSVSTPFARPLDEKIQVAVQSALLLDGGGGRMGGGPALVTQLSAAPVTVVQG